MCARKYKPMPLPELNPLDKDCFHVLIFNDEEGIDQLQFSRLMASVRKAAPHIRFKINLKVSIEL